MPPNDAVEGKLSYGFDFLGEQQVKNISKPVPAGLPRARRAQVTAGARLA